MSPRLASEEPRQDTLDPAALDARDHVARPAGWPTREALEDTARRRRIREWVRNREDVRRAQREERHADTHEAGCPCHACPYRRAN